MHIKDKLVVMYDSLQIFLFEANHNLMKIRCLIQNFSMVSYLKMIDIVLFILNILLSTNKKE